MRSYVGYALVLFAVVSLTGCGALEEQSDKLNGGESEKKVVRGLKEALKVGANNASESASEKNGFYENPNIKIQFPPEAEPVKQKAKAAGLDDKVKKFVKTMNRGAEDAASKAGPIFLDAIANMSIEDGKQILEGDDDAATRYLERETEDELFEAFKPEVKESLEQVEVTKYWNPLADAYNTATAVTGGEEIDPNLNDYVTKKAIDGLFYLMAQEEKKIREDPEARTSQLLKDVFGDS